ncbi:hypothetical protein SISSUDRAFT_1052943 [Sistotremastrum suecicum HHB10207 ss-3]|uniref:Uncharacterized protein n=1 Tax=Sistotremastrum suecicum HHB10207 ss-3 TaxID=1314776 RepID=A0A165ZIL9_9AGAM|nr:hypothetical protein SISSUDRAFT_1052943 [Sistotremastrum suecicum HHB10207 ss-3]
MSALKVFTSPAFPEAMVLSVLSLLTHPTGPTFLLQVDQAPRTVLNARALLEQKTCLFGLSTLGRVLERSHELHCVVGLQDIAHPDFSHLPSHSVPCQGERILSGRRSLSQFASWFSDGTLDGTITCTRADVKRLP